MGLDEPSESEIEALWVQEAEHTWMSWSRDGRSRYQRKKCFAKP